MCGSVSGSRQRGRRVCLRDLCGACTFSAFRGASKLQKEVGEGAWEELGQRLGVVREEIRQPENRNTLRWLNCLLVL